MAVKPRPHTLARAADRSSVRTPPPPPPIPGKVRVTPARTGGPSHRYVVGKNKLWFANATRTPPPQTEPTRLERHRHHCFSRPYAGTETATKCRDRRGTISLDWNNCVQCISKLRGACGGCTRSSLVQKKRAAHCMMHIVTAVATGAIDKHRLQHLTSYVPDQLKLRVQTQLGGQCCLAVACEQFILT